MSILDFTPAELALLLSNLEEEESPVETGPIDFEEESAARRDEAECDEERLAWQPDFEEGTNLDDAMLDHLIQTSSRIGELADAIGLDWTLSGRESVRSSRDDDDEDPFETVDLPRSN